MKTLLIDMRNIGELSGMLLAKFSKPNQLNGFDIETQDEGRHEGLNRAMKVDDEGHKSAASKLMFDVNRTVVTGFSLYADHDDVAYYFNLAHADVENRIPFEVIRPLLDAIKANGYFVSHKSPFELTMMFKSLGYDLGEKILCTLQLAVTCFNADTYPIDKFLEPGLGEGFGRLMPQINALYTSYDGSSELTTEQEELLFKFIAKESDAEHSYNGYVKSIAYGYGLKRLTKYFLNYDQKSFEETLKGKAHMGQLTGDETVAYGADDAWTCMHLFHKLMAFLMETNPTAVKTYFEQENPMCQVYSKTWREGVVTNRQKVLEGQAIERKSAADVLRQMKASIRKLLPFPEDIHEKLVKYDPKGYGKPGTAEKYRRQVEAWANSPDSEDDYTQLMQCRTSLSKEWSESKGDKESSGPSITYYQVVRCLMYDLCRCSFQLLDGKIQSDAEAQDRARSRWVKAKGYTTKQQEADDPTLQLLDAYKKLSASNQSIKLYINNYLNMIDPETNRVYPILSSQLNSRRMAIETPNLSQLAKNAASSYVRGYFEADEPDHVVVSADWSGVELVLIGDASGDPGFKEVFGQLPHGDLHTGTAVDLLNAVSPLTLEEFLAKPDAERKKLRTDVGKGSNFGFWYSGALGTVAREIGLTSDQMWDMVERYRNRFAVAEQWRVGTINEASMNGLVRLPDGNIRYRYESTPMWANHMRNKFATYGAAAKNFGEIAIKKIRARSGNQAVNSRIQGTCATLAKRSILTMERVIKDKGYRARFMFPVHDELVYSVHKDEALAFMKDLYVAMCHHPDIVKTLILDCAMAVGLNYWAYNPEKNPKGQVELEECSKKLPCIPEERWGKKLTDSERQTVVDWLFT